MDELTVPTKERKAGMKRFTKYQKIICDYYCRGAWALNEVQLEVVRQMQKYPENSIQYLLGLLWLNLVLERRGVYTSLMDDEYMNVAEHQRGIYAVLRFCMEMVADAYYLVQHPKELENFLTDGDEIVEAIKKIENKDISDIQKDKKFAALSSKGKIRGCISNRIEDVFPGQLQDYRMFCMHTHLNMQGMRIYYADDALDLLFAKYCSVMMSTLETLFILIDAVGLVTEDAENMFRNVYRLMLECNQEVQNLYYGKNDETRHISDERVTQEHRDFCNRKEALAKPAADPESESAKQEP